MAKNKFDKEKIRIKYPNLQTDEEYIKLEKMLIYSKYESIMGIGGPVLLLLCGFLLSYFLRSFWVLLCTGVGMILVSILAEHLFGSHVDNVFIAKASRKTGILTREMISKAVKCYAKKPETVRLLKVKLIIKNESESYGGEYDSGTEYYFGFDCGTYGALMTKVTYEDYVCAEENQEYFVLLNVGRRQNSIERIYSTKEYTLSSELESILEII